MTTNFETEVCSRCHGTGEYSFNGEHSRCYKCDGKNGARALTKRGAAAKAYYLAKFQVPVTSIKVGDLVSTVTGGKLRVREIRVSPNKAIINGAPATGNVVTLIGNSYSITVCESTIVRRFPTEEENQAAIADALAYQATLTKTGSPRKR